MRILRQKAVDYVLVLVVVVSLSLNSFQAFVITDDLALNVPLTLVLAGVALLALYACFFNFKSSLISGAVLVVAVIAFALYSNATDLVGRLGITLEEQDAYYLIIVACAVGAYALSRSRVGTIVLFLGGVAIFFLLSVLEYGRFTGWFLACLLAVAVLFLRRVYLAAPSASKAGGAGLLRYTGLMLAVCGLALVLSGGAFAAITVLFHPQTQPLALLTNYTVLEMAAKVGAASPTESSIANDYYTQNYEAVAQSSTDDSVQAQNSSETSDASTTSGSGDVGTSASGDNDQGTGDTSQEIEAKPITYFSHIPWVLIIALAVVGIIVAAYLLKLSWRRRQAKKVAALTPGEQVLALYPAYLKVLKRIGLARHETQTPIEFSQGLERSVNTIRFEDVGFGEVTTLFDEVAYGGLVPSEAQVARLWEFDRAFLRCCRRRIGLPRYLLRYLVL